MKNVLPLTIGSLIGVVNVGNAKLEWINGFVISQNGYRCAIADLATGREFRFKLRKGVDAGNFSLIRPGKPAARIKVLSHPGILTIHAHFDATRTRIERNATQDGGKALRMHDSGRTKVVAALYPEG